MAQDGSIILTVKQTTTAHGRGVGIIIPKSHSLDFNPVYPIASPGPVL